MSRVVLESGLSRYGVGSVVDPATAARVEQQGGTAVPVAPADGGFGAREVPGPLAHNGAGAWALRHWGQGWELGQVPARCCPMVLWVEAGYRYVHWRAKVAVRRGSTPGSLRVVGDQGQRSVAGGFASTPECLAKWSFGEQEGPDQTTVVVGGCVRWSAVQDCYLGLAFWGQGEGQVLWTAVSQADEP